MLKIVLVLCFSMMSLFVVSAQDELYIEACELETLNSQVNMIIDDYISTRVVDSSTDGALVSVEVMLDALTQLHQDCLQTQQDARIGPLSMLLDDLNEGGYIIYVRHTHTDRSGSGDTDRDGCEAERNLSTRGRLEAQAIKRSYEALGLPVDAIISTELCRTLDTTELAFGKPTEIIPRSELEGSLADVLTKVPPEGLNVIIVAHIATLNRNFGLPIPFDEGDAYVFEPMGDEGFQLVGRISLTDWELLAELASEDS